MAWVFEKGSVAFSGFRKPKGRLTEFGAEVLDGGGQWEGFRV